MNDSLLVVSLILSLVGCCVCAHQAGEKQRSVVGWGIIGFMFPLIGVIAAITMKSHVVLPDDDHYANYY